MPPRMERATRSSDGSSMMAHAKALAEQAEKIAMKAIEEGARHVLQSGPLASEYVQAMGSWTFTVIVPLKDGSFFEELIGGDDYEIGKLTGCRDELEPEYASAIEPFVEELKKFQELVDTYEDLFGNTPAGTPMRFKAAGPVTKRW